MPSDAPTLEDVKKWNDRHGMRLFPADGRSVVFRVSYGLTHRHCDVTRMATCRNWGFTPVRWEVSDKETVFIVKETSRPLKAVPAIETCGCLSWLHGKPQCSWHESMRGHPLCPGPYQGVKALCAKPLPGVTLFVEDSA